jgi:hypothetical protein
MRILVESGRQCSSRMSGSEVWEMVLGPGESCRRHKHNCDYMVVYVTRSRLELYVDKRAPRLIAEEDGHVIFSAVGPDGLTPHYVKNVDTKSHRQIVVEFIGSVTSDRPEQLDVTSPDPRGLSLDDGEDGAVEAWIAGGRREPSRLRP